MKVGDLIRRKDPNLPPRYRRKFLVVRKKKSNFSGYDMLWIYPDLYPDSSLDHTDDDNYYYAKLFEVVSESR